MAFRFEIDGYFFRVTETTAPEIVINETRESLKWTINEDGEYQFVQKGAVPQSNDGISPTILNIGQSFAFANIVDENDIAFASESNLQTWLSTYIGYICCGSVEVEVNGTSEGELPCGVILEVEVTDGTDPVTPDSVSLVGNTLTIAVPAGGVTPVGATLMKTGQTTSFRTGDDGDIEAGRATNFTTLAVNNPFGNTNRFTDELGGSTYTNNIVIDWSTYDNVAGTVLGIVKNFITLGTANWDNAIDNSLAYSVGTFTTGWRLINRTEINNLCNIGNNNYPLNYAPFNAVFGAATWTSNTFTSLNTFAWYLNNTAGDIRYQAKTTTSYYIPVRTFTVTGTTLT